MRYILKWNPELAKNLWTEFSPQRLVAMPRHHWPHHAPIVYQF